MEGGDRASISFDAGDFDATFCFEGAKAPAVEYLKNVYLASLSDESFALPFEEYVAKLGAK